MTPTKAAAAPKAPRKAKAPAKKKEAAAAKTVVHHKTVPHKKETEVKLAVEQPADKLTEKTADKPGAKFEGKYIFATGRRKTAVANVRLYPGKGQAVINKKPLEKYFQYSYYQEEINKPFQLTGLEGQYSVVGHLNGGGPHSQAQALQHGISIALGKISEDVRKVLKKNGLLTRDDRKKERKKPGLKRARRSPQWAKR